jgi:hypothetical protein
MLDGTSSLLSGKGAHPPSLPRRPSLTLFFVALESRGEIQIYAPTAPGVFFELMKNESARPAQSHSLPPPPFFLFHPVRRHPPSPSLCSPEGKRGFSKPAQRTVLAPPPLWRSFIAARAGVRTPAVRRSR